jgi:D-galactarolactone cycloisomerase
MLNPYKIWRSIIMPSQTTLPMTISEARVYHLSAPLDKPYQTTFGTMTRRQAVIITLTDERGIAGMGESWINFPLWAPWERVAAFTRGYFPQIIGKAVEDIPGFVRGLWIKNYRATLQSATLGPALQALCAVEAALWDIQGKRRKVPVRKLFSDNPASRVKMYGSGINPPFLEDAIKEALDLGMDTFKLKLGYGDGADKENIRLLKTILGPGGKIAVDVNRSWTFDKTMSWMEYFRDEGIVWLEEPLSIEEQHRYPELLARTTVPLSAGENFLIPPRSSLANEGEGGLTFNQSTLALDIIQPAVVKNCCFSDAVRLMDLVENIGKKLWPHFLGSAPGFAATAHLVSLTHEPYLEWDINPNPLRTSLFNEPFLIEDGFFIMNEIPGWGYEMNCEKLEKWEVKQGYY